MDRDWLEARLTAGRSIESIAKEVGKHPSTVSYWLDKHGLVSVFAERHAAKGPPDRDLIAALIMEELTVQQMAERLGLGATTVRYWLRKYGLKTARARGSAPAAGRRLIIRECPRHGYTAWVRTMTVSRARCSSTISIQPRSRLPSPCREWRDRWRKQGPRRQNACSCARTATPK